MSGQWPPEWEDPVPGFPEDSGQYLDEPDVDARLSGVPAILASAPMPVLPVPFEARISAAIAAEAAARAAGGVASGAGRASGTGTGTGAVPVAAPASGGPDVVPAGARTGVTGAPRARGRTRPGTRQDRRLRRLIAAGSALACLLLIAVGYALSGQGPSSRPAGSAAAAPAGSGPRQNASGAAQPFIQSRPDQARQAIGGKAAFAVIQSGISYSRATLATQVRQELAAAGSAVRAGSGTSPARDSSGHTAASPSAAIPSPAGGGGSPAAAAVPSPGLAACVLRLTGNVKPSLVDRATYAGRAAYVIAVPSRVWVVGPGCTAAHPELITSLSLAG